MGTCSEHFEPQCQKTYLQIWAPIEDSNQPAHRAAWSESSRGAFWIANDAKFLRVQKDDSNQTARMRRLIWVYVGRPCQVRFLMLWLVCTYVVAEVVICSHPERGHLKIGKNMKILSCITKTSLFKYIENFTTQKKKKKKGKFEIKKNNWYFTNFYSKHRLWVLVRSASPRRGGSN